MIEQKERTYMSHEVFFAQNFACGEKRRAANEHQTPTLTIMNP